MMQVFRNCVVVLALLGAACDASDSEESPGERGDAGAGSHDADSQTEGEPLWLLQTRVFTDDGATGYLIPTTTLDGHIDNSHALEQPGGGVAYVQPGTHAFLVGTGEEPNLTRYEISGDDHFIKGKTLSFSNEGVMSLYGGVVFVGAHTAYLLDIDQFQAIRFDPTKMEIVRVLSLAGAARKGYVTDFGHAVVREDGIYFPTRSYSEDSSQVPSGATLVHIDPETDEVTITHDERCTSLLVDITTEAGDTYWFSDMINAIARIGYGGEHGQPDCALRLRAGESTFDPDWDLDIGERTGGRPAVGALHGGGSTIWMRVFEDEAVDLPEPAAYELVDTAKAWQWYSLDVESDDRARRDDQRPRSSHGNIGMQVDGESFTTIENAEYTETQIVERTADAFVVRGSVDGVVDTIARVR